MATFTSTLPDDLLKKLSDKSIALSLPKNKLIEKAVFIYLEHLERAEYIKSYKRAANDADVLKMAEYGMEEYLKKMDA
jgi:hypothetical protein